MKKFIAFLLTFLLILQVVQPVYAEDSKNFSSSTENYRQWKENLGKEYYAKLAQDGINKSVSVDGNNIHNEYISAIVNGKFTMATTGGNPKTSTDDNKLLLFGYPDPWSSYSTIRINGADYIFNPTEVYSCSQDEISYKMVIGNTDIVQKISFVTNDTTGRQDLAKISYEIKNKGTDTINAGTRIMMDTMLGENDGAPFRVPGYGDVVNELELNGSQIPQFWQSFDSLDTPNVVSNGVLYKTLSEKPDKVIFADWEYMYGTYWDYNVDASRYITGDSAIAIYHNPKPVAPGQTIVTSTYYGIGDFAVSDLKPPLSVRVFAPQRMEVDTYNGNYFGNPFTISAYVKNSGDGISKNTRLYLDLPVDKSLLLLNSDQSVNIGDIGIGEEKIVSWKVFANSQLLDKTVNYKISVESDNFAMKTLPLSIILPRVTNIQSGKITLNKTSLAMNAGDKETLIATLTGITGNITWFSSNPGVASVNYNGVVTAKAGGKAVISATVCGKIATCNVMVTGAAPELESISFTEGNVNIGVNQTKQLYLNFNPSNAVNKKILSWKSSNTKVVTINNGKIKGISSGTAVITAVSEQGGKTANCTVKVSAVEPELNLGPGLYFSQNVSGPTVNFGGKSFSIFKIPIETEIKFLNAAKLVYDPEENNYKVYFGDLSEPAATNDTNPDGTLTNDAKALRKEAYQNIKSLMSMVGKKTNRDFYTAYRRLFAKTSPFSIEGNKTMFGYATFVRTNSGFQLTDGEVCALFEAGVFCKVPFPNAPALYCKFGVSGSLQGGIKLVLKEKGNLQGGINFYGNIEATFTPKFELGGDIKVAKADVGLEGEFKSVFTFPFNTSFDMNSDLKVTFKGYLYMEYEAFLFINGSHKWKFAECNIYPPDSGTSADLINIDTKNLVPIPRDYLNKSSSFMANEKLIQRNININTIVKSNVYPYCTPKIANLKDGKKLIVWVDDDANRSSLNRTAVMYSIFDGTNWTAPAQIDNDGTADFNPVIAISGDNVYAAWQSADYVFDDTVDAQTMSSAMGIKFARFDGEKFIDITSVTGINDGLDNAPEISCSGSNAAVVWSNNSLSDVSGNTGTNTIKRFNRVGASGQTETIAADLPLITYYRTAYNGDINVIAYGLDMDGDTSTSNDEELFVITGNSTERLTNNDTADINPEFVTINNKTDLYWYSDGQIKHMPDMDKTKIFTEIEDADELSDFKVLDNGSGDRVIYWNNPDGFKSNIYGILFDSEQSKWGKPVELVNSNSRIRSNDAVINSDGSVEFLYNSVAVNNITSEDDEIFGQADLMHTKIIPTCNLSIAGSAAYDKSKVKPGGILPIDVEVQNSGNKTVKGVHIDIMDSSDKIIKGEDVTMTIMPGDSKIIETNYTLPLNLLRHDIKIRVTPLNAVDEDLSDNIENLTIGYADIHTGVPQISGYGDTRSIKAKIQNLGYDNAENITVKLISDSLDGTVLGTRVIDKIAPRESKYVDFTINMNDMNFINDGNDKLLYVTAETAPDDNTGFNSNSAVLENPYNNNWIQISETGISGQTLFLNAVNNLPEKLNASIVVEILKKGKIVLSCSEDVELEPLFGDYMQFDLSYLSMYPHDMVRIFAVDENDKTISNECIINGQIPKRPDIIINLDKYYLMMKAGDSAAIKANVTPDNYSTVPLTYSSSDENIVSVDENGVITAKSKGTAIVTVRNDILGAAAECRIDVTEAEPAKEVIQAMLMTTSSVINVAKNTGEKISLLLVIPQNKFDSTKYAGNISRDLAFPSNTIEDVILTKTQDKDPVTSSIFTTRVLDDRSFLIVPTLLAASNKNYINKSYKVNVLVKLSGIADAIPAGILAIKTTINDPKLSASKVTLDRFNYNKVSNVTFKSSMSDITDIAIDSEKYVKNADGTYKTDSKGNKIIDTNNPSPDYFQYDYSAGTIKLNPDKISEIKAGNYKLRFNVNIKDYIKTYQIVISINVTNILPKLKLSKTTLKMYENSHGYAVLELVCTNPHDNLNMLGVTNVRIAAQSDMVDAEKAVYKYNDLFTASYDYDEGRIYIRLLEGNTIPSNIKILLAVTFNYTNCTMNIPVSISKVLPATIPVFKATPSSIVLNTTLSSEDDTKDIFITDNADNIDIGNMILYEVNKSGEELPVTNFSIYQYGNYITVCLKDASVLPGSYKVRVKFGNYTSSKPVDINIKVVNTAPVITMSPSSITLNRALEVSYERKDIIVKTNPQNIWLGELRFFEVDKTGKESDITPYFNVYQYDNTITLSLRDQSVAAGTYKIRAIALKYPASKPADITVKVIDTQPVLKLSSTSITLNSALFMDDEFKTLNITSVPGGIYLGTLNIYELDKTGNEIGLQNFIVSQSDDRINISLANKNVLPGTYKIRLRSSRYPLLKPVDIAVKVINTPPVFSLSANKISLNKTLKSEIDAKELTIKSNMNNIDPGDFVFYELDSTGKIEQDVNDFNVQQSGNSIDIALGKNDIVEGNYKLRMKSVKYPTAKPVDITVSVIGTLPVLTLSTSGSINIINPESYIIVKPKLSGTNAVLNEDSLFSLDNPKFEIFDYDSSTLSFKIIAKQGAMLQKGVKELVNISYTFIDGTKITAKTLTINPVQSNVKLSLDKKTITLYSKDKYFEDYIKINVTNPENAKIANVTIDDINKDNFKIRKVSDEYGVYAIGFKNYCINKSYKVTLYIWIEGSETPVQSSITINVIN